MNKYDVEWIDFNGYYHNSIVEENDSVKAEVKLLLENNCVKAIAGSSKVPDWWGDYGN